jgi:putative transposase
VILKSLLRNAGLSVDHSTIHRWVVRYAPQLEENFRKKYKREVNGSWRMDETYLKIKGEDVYLYRAVDKNGDTVDFMLSRKRDKKVAFRIFQKTIGQHGLPEKITMDKSGANKSGVDKINLLLTLLCLLTGIFYHIIVRQIKYLNNNEINQVLRGHYAYYGLGGNHRSLWKIYRFTERYWHKMLSRRSWKSYIT